MCGIFGILGKRPVAMDVVSALKRLEYRGYDSAGIATLEDGQLDRRRAEGKLLNLEIKLSNAPLSGVIGIGHTRWATHGRPNEVTAHPHATSRLAVVHNGIIENHRALRAELVAAGIRFETETDTEVVAQLVTQALSRMLDPVEAVAVTLPRLRGSFALAFLFAGCEDLLIGAGHGAPLAIGHGDGEMYLGSDALALAPFTSEITYLENGDWAAVSRKDFTIRNTAGQIVKRARHHIPAGTALAGKESFRHFMAKEIYEQPEVARQTLAPYLDREARRVRLPPLPFALAQVSRAWISGCGTAFHAGLLGRHWLESLARVPVEADVASELRYRRPPLTAGDLSLFVSQSGETADTLAALRHARESGHHVASIVNVLNSTIARESSVVLPTLAGPEIGVASTKAFSCQLAVLLCLAIAVGRARGVVSESEEATLVDELIALPALIEETLKLSVPIELLARRLSSARDLLYIGRGLSYPLALEGALKLKEISYLHAEGHAAGELKHGPIALIEDGTPVIVLAPSDEVFEKTMSNMQEVVARGAAIVLITDAAGAAACDAKTLATLVVPTVHAAVSRILYAIPLQLLAYQVAVCLGRDVDQPRNLAKSVTVE